jgi:putative RNA 2'-phosphotransferase
MKQKDLVRTSKRLSRYLRHAPGRIGLELQPGGWVDVDDLLDALARHDFPLSRADLDTVVAGNDKQRFALDDTGTRIRASQGHSVAVELDLPPADPPATLYHGTVGRVLEPILHEGLLPMGRHDVHLSATVETARTVGARRGRPVVLRVDAQEMNRVGLGCRVSANGVWLTPRVPPRFLYLHEE